VTGPDLPGIGGLSQAYLSGRLTAAAVLEDTLARIAAADGALFIRTEKHLYRVQEP